LRINGAETNKGNATNKQGEKEEEIKLPIIKID